MIESQMTSRSKYFLIALLVLLAAVFTWYLKTIVIYLCVSVVLSMIGQPLVRIYSGIRIKRFSLPDGISALLALLTICAAAGMLVSLFIPLIVEEARIISHINPNEVVSTFREPLQNLQYDLQKFQINYGNGESIEKYIAEQLTSLINFKVISGYAQGMIGFTASLIGACFAILFMTFFFMKDEQMIVRFVLLLTPPKHTEAIKEIMRDTRRLLTRYFIGILCDMLFVATLTSIGLGIIGVPNALLIGMFAGLLNIIPYLGPLIGLAFGLLIGITSSLDIDFYTQLLPLLGKICITFLIVQVVDAVFFQPLVISNIVKAHPLEIFLVILVAGTLTGIPGMIVAVPVYTILRIIAKEFLSNFQLVKRLTEDLEE
jgi:predicted PurR-regulated permease PerM